MKFRVTVEIGQVTVALRGKWMLKTKREVTSWWIKVGPLIVIRSGLPFSRKAASDCFWALHNGPAGDLARAKRRGY